MIRILLADDHVLVRQGFKLILSGQPDMQIAGEAANGREAVEQAENGSPSNGRHHPDNRRPSWVLKGEAHSPGTFAW